VRRGFVEDWLGQKEADAKRLEARRFNYVFWFSLVAAIAAVIARVANGAGLDQVGELGAAVGCPKPPYAVPYVRATIQQPNPAGNCLRF
jgi:hypothetical protein